MTQLAPKVIRYVLHISLPAYTGFEDEMIEQANQCPEDGQENHANKFHGNRHNLLEPDDNRCAARTSDGGGFPEPPKYGETWGIRWVVGHENLLFGKQKPAHLPFCGRNAGLLCNSPAFQKPALCPVCRGWNCDYR
jgi:hypothetical protein